jgi:heme exporter protein C
MKLAWWKILCIVLLFYTVVAGFLLNVPRLAILNESIRNLYFHVPMWFGMIIIMLVSVVYSIRYLQRSAQKFDDFAVSAAHTGIVFGLLGLVTGMTWARYTWGAWWVNDPKLNGAAIGLLIYSAYIVLRNSLEDEQQRARISAIYNIFAFSTLVPLLFILPRLTDSLHPGNGGNPGFSSYDLDSKMRMVFYPAVIGWTLLGVWITQLSYRLRSWQRGQEEVDSLRSMANSHR